MFKNFNWGHGLFIFFVFFVSSLVFILFKSFGVSRDLVKEDYYVDDMQLTALIEHRKNQANLADFEFEYLARTGMVVIQFPKELTPQGTMRLYRPSDKNLDIVQEIKTNSNNAMEISVASLKKGLWKVKLEWSDGEKVYYFEEAIVL
jgi:nitrogen fixation protein FixH